jgi:hypothetical protein
MYFRLSQYYVGRGAAEWYARLPAANYELGSIYSRALGDSSLSYSDEVTEKSSVYNILLFVTHIYSSGTVLGKE